MNTCSTCKHFSEAPPESQDTVEGGWGACDLSIENNHTYRRAVMVNPAGHIESIPVRFVAMGIRSFEGALAVHRDFGCNQHEWRLTPEEETAA